MALSLEQKKTVVTEVASVAQDAHSALAVEYRGLTVAEMTDLRVKARNAGVYLRVVRNTLARRALEDTEFACMREALVGPLLLAFSQADPGAAARVVEEYAKGNDKLVVKLVAFGGKLLPPEDISVLANLPTREQALATLLSVMNAPVTKLVRTIAEPHSRLVRTVASVRDQKQAA